MGKDKLDCIEMLISQTISDLNISHEEFKAIIDEKKDYDNQKEYVKDKILSETLQVQNNIIFWLNNMKSVKTLKAKVIKIVLIK